jgi:hypothetical protein
MAWHCPTHGVRLGPVEQGRQARKVKGTGSGLPKAQFSKSRKQKWRPERAQATRKPIGCDAQAILSCNTILQPSCNYYATIMYPLCNH